MIKVGLTGGIGSGKSTVARIFESFGIPVYNSDDRAKFLMNNDETLMGEIISRFGEQSYINGELNRPYLAEVVFKDKSSIQDLNALVHPAVARDFDNWVSQQKSPYILKEAAILIESGAYKTLDQIVVVSTDEKIRIERVMKRDGATEEQVTARIKNQMSEEERLKYADFTIDNNGGKMLIPQVRSVHENILATN